MLGAMACAVEAGPVPAFHTDVQPILTERCVKCHGPEKAKAALRLDSLAAVLKGSDEGPVAEAGKPESSVLLKLVSLPVDDGERMPPKGEPLTAEQIAILRLWIAGGMKE